MKLENKITIVTGGALGIGKAIAIRFAQEGSDVVIADINQEASRIVLEEIGKTGRKAKFVKTDTSKTQDVENLLAESVKAFERIDILVNNAGIFKPSSFLDGGMEDWERIMSVNLRGYYLCAQAVAKQMIKQGSGGRIINIASDSGRATLMGVCTPYSVSKAGVIHLNRIMAVELGQYGINVNAISPYVTETPLVTRGYSKERWREVVEEYGRKCPLGRIGQPEDVAGPCVFFASEDSAYVTGQNLYLGASFLP